MVYEKKLAERIRKQLVGDAGVAQRKMFGGIAFIPNGDMFFGILREDFMARVAPEAFDEALAKPHTREMDFARPSHERNDLSHARWGRAQGLEDVSEPMRALR